MMVHKSLKIQIWSAIVIITAALAILAATSSNGNETQEHNQVKQASTEPVTCEKPIIIWYHHVYKDPPAALRMALSSGLITHAMVQTLHRKDGERQKMELVAKAIKIVKTSDVKLIWSRPLWALYGIEDSSAEDLFDPNYYIQEIEVLRAEGQAFGADFVALDAESYAHAPVNKYLRGKNRLNTYQRKRLSAAVEQVIGAVGQVDFLCPGGSIYSQHPANTLGRLGKCRISGFFYYGNEERRRSMRFPYHIVGIHVNTTRENKEYPQLPYYYVSEVFTQSHLWSGKKGVFIYPHDRKGLAIAKKLVAYSKQLPVKNNLGQN